MSVSEHAEGAAVSVLGLGNMGAALARAFVRAGHTVTVWNRSPGRAEPFAGTAKVAATAADACEASALVVVCLTSRAASREALETPAVAAALSGRTLVQLSSGTPADARSAAAWGADHAISYLDGAILEYPAGIGAAETAVLYAGAAEVFRRHEPTLRALGGAATHVGEAIGAASAYDCAYLLYFCGASVAFANGAAYAAAEGIGPADYQAAIESILPLLARSQAEYAEQMSAGEWPGSEATLPIWASALRNLVRASEESGVDARLPVALATLTERAIDLGHRDSGLAALFTTLRSSG